MTKALEQLLREVEEQKEATADNPALNSAFSWMAFRLKGILSND